MGPYVFGNGYILKNKTYTWSPDDRKTQNGHVLIVGSSGSGKTHLLLNLINNLYINNKQVYIIDFHGDMKTENETLYTFSLRNSQYGLNPFDMEFDSSNGGPNAQANIVLANFKKNFIPNMGAIQKSVFRTFLIDCYRYVGILDEDETTWGRPLPTVSSMQELYNKITEIISNAESVQINRSLEKMTKINKKIFFEEFEEKKILLKKKLQNEMEKFASLMSKYNEYLLEGKHSNVFNTHISPYIDTEYYLKSSTQKVFLGLAPYLSELSTSSVFNDNKPPKAKGVVRYDISGFTNTDKPSEAMFFSDTVIQKIFRAVKMRGLYKDLKKKGKIDTFIVIDESKLILPTGKDKENPYNILNRTVGESRKYGLGLIIVSQRPEHFPEEMLSSIYTKIILRINENDIPSASKSLGVKDSSLFGHLRAPHVALIGHTGGLFESVSLR